MSIDIVSKFESIGDNCEFGLLQRAYGFEYSNLFRWSYSFSNEAVIALLEREFEGIFEFENLTPRAGGDMVNDSPNGIAFHSVLRSEAHDQEWMFLKPEAERRQLHANETSKIAHLKRNTLEALRSAKRIFVYKRNSGTTDKESRKLLDLLRAYNPNNRLLTVSLANDGKPAGHVEEVQVGMYKGYIDQFAPYDNAHAFSDRIWIEILEKVTTLAKDRPTETEAIEVAKRRVWQATRPTRIRYRHPNTTDRYLDEYLEAPNGAILVGNWEAHWGGRV